MKRSKKLLILVAVLVAAYIATIILTQYEEKQEKIKNSDAIILEISVDEVESLAWKSEEGELAFHKSEETWIYDEDETFPVSEEKIASILSHFESFGVSFIIENVEDYSQYGLEDPECTLQFTTAEESYEVKLGDFSKMDEQRYVDIGDGNVYLVSQDPMDYLETELSGMILNDEIPYMENVTKIEFAGSETSTITYVENSTDTYSEEDVYFVEQDGQTLPLDTNKIAAYLDTISYLDLESYATYHATEEELASYGLDEPELSVTVTYTDTEDEEEITDSCVLHISRNPEERKAAEEAEANGEDEIPAVTEYVRVGDSKIVYVLDETAYDTLVAVSYNDLRHKEVFWADFDMVTKVDITLEGETHTITSEIDEEDEEERIWYYQEEKVSIDQLQSKLSALEAARFTTKEAEEKEEISLTLYLENENISQVKIQLYRYDGTYCLAVVDGESVSLVERSEVMDLVEAVQKIVLD